MDLPAHFGKYLLVHQLGRGGMAELFLAKQSGLKGFEKILAIKKILPHLTQDPEFVTMFVNEGKLAALLTHQHIAQIFDLGHVEGAYYMAMEYVMGKDLRSLVAKARERGGRLPLDCAILIVSQVASGLDYAHRKKDLNGRDLNIVHRDVSPQNVLVSYEGEVKLVDFGIAKAASSGQETQTGVLKGKLAYMSPEQACGRHIDRRSDVFSLGIVLYELLTGRRLFKGDSDLSTLEQVRTAHVEPPRQFDADIPEALEAVMLKALAREADQRYQTASELQAALERIMADRGQGFSSLHLSQYLAVIFAEEMRLDAERFQAAHQETVRLGATVTKLSPGASGPRHETPRPLAVPRAAPRSAPPPVGHGTRNAVLGAVVLFLLGGAIVLFTPSVLQWTKTQPSHVRHAGMAVEERLKAWGLSQFVPRDEGKDSPAAAVVPTPVTDEVASSVPPDLAPPPPSGSALIPAETPTPVSIDPSVEVPIVSAIARPELEPGLPPEDVKRLLNKARALYAAGRLDAVEDVLRTVIDRAPNSPLAYHLLGTVYLERKDEERALKIFSEASHQFPNHATLHYDLGFLYAQRGLGSLAREELTRALALQPEGGLGERARLFLRTGTVGRPSGPPPGAMIPPTEALLADNPVPSPPADSAAHAPAPIDPGAEIQTGNEEVP
jgi:tetratricopeptide (TPR) repeat protein